MAGKSDYLENKVLALIFNAQTIANIADNASSGPLTNLYVRLHTSDPTDAANAQTTNKYNYVGYSSVAVARTSGGWTITGSSVSPTSPITFPTAGTGTTPQTASHVTIGTQASPNAGQILFSGALSPAISIVEGVTPEIKTTSTITED